MFELEDDETMIQVYSPLHSSVYCLIISPQL